MANPKACDDVLWGMLEQVNLADFLRGENGLDTMLKHRTFLAVSVSVLRWQELCSMTAQCIFLTKLPPTLMWRVKMILWHRFMGLPEQRPLSLFLIVLQM